MNQQANGYPRHFIVTAIISSLLLSIYKIYFSPLINTDAILYLIAAETTISSGIGSSLAIYSWPFFHWLISAIHSITGLPLLTSAQLIMAGCYVVLTLGFCNVIRALGGDRKTLWFGLLIILCHPIVIDFRPTLIRDPGMIGFTLLALSAQLNLAASCRWADGIKWATYVTIAFLFRSEALVLMALAPLAMLALKDTPIQQRLMLAVKMYLLPLITSVCAVVYFLFSATAPGDNLKLLTDIEFIHKNLQHLNTRLDTLSSVVANQILAEFSTQDATLAVLAIIATILTTNIIRAITFPYLIALLLPRLSRRYCGPLSIPAPKYRNPILCWYGIIILGYLSGFALFTQFSLTRYCLQLAVLLLIPLPFFFSNWWSSPQRNTFAKVTISLILVVNGLDGLISSAWKKTNIRDAALWIRETNSIEEGSLVTNEPFIGYFGEKSTTGFVLRAINASRQPLTERRDTFWLAAYTYAQRVAHGEQEKALQSDIKRAEGELIKVFDGQDNKTVYIFTVGKDVERSPLLLERPE